MMKYRDPGPKGREERAYAPRALNDHITGARFVRNAEPVRLYSCPSFTPGHVMIRVRGVAGEVTVIAPRDSRGNALRAALQLAGGAA